MCCGIVATSYQCKVLVHTLPGKSFPVSETTWRDWFSIFISICEKYLDLLGRTAAMWIQVRTMDGKETHRIDSLSKLTKVDELRLKIAQLFKVEPERQRLFYRGKQVKTSQLSMLAE